MNSKEFIKQLMKIKGITQEDLANRLGYARQTSISTLLNEGRSLNVANLVAMMSEMGYDLYAVDKETGQKTKITDKKERIHARNKTNHVGRPKKGVIHKKPPEEPVTEVTEAKKKEIPVFQYGK